MAHSGNDRGFLPELWGLMLPIVLQNLLSAAVSAADVLMLSGVGEAALSASSLAGQVTFVLTLFYLGLSTGASVLAAQYWGKGDRATIGAVQGLALRCSCAVSLAFFIAALGAPGLLMRVFTSDEALIGLGMAYLRWVSVSYLMMGVSQMLLAVMKSIGQTRVSAGVSVSCMLCNILLNAAAIYLLFPGRASLALRGVAGATSIARVLELALCLLAIRRGKGIPTPMAALLRTPRWLTRDYWKCTLPVQANYLIWGCATAGIAAILGHMGSAMVAANSLASTLRGLVIVGCSGLGAAGSIMVGNALGRGDFAGAKGIGQRVFVGSLGLGAISGLLLLALYRPCLALARLEGDAASLFRAMLVVNAVYCVGKSFNSSMVGGVFCAGGDTRFGLICDTIAMWGVILPLGALAAFAWHWQPIAVYIILCMDEFVKLPFVALRFRQYKWLNDLTKEEREDDPYAEIQ